MRFFFFSTLFSLLVHACEQPSANREPAPAIGFEEVFTVSLQDELSEASFLSLRDSDGAFALGVPKITVVVDSAEFSGVRKVAEWFKNDLENVTGAEVTIVSNIEAASGARIVVGSLERGEVLKPYLERLSVVSLSGKWEQFAIAVQDDDLIIAGSDKRGVIFGMLELSRQMGVSPWYWWADVPVKQRKELYVKPGVHTQGEPKVKYRGIFINDEAPALAGWAHEKFGGFNHQFYEKVYELILRHKANYLWPAMWGRAIYDDDPQSPVLADELGVVIGTSHHEPLMRAHVEWSRYGEGPWNYEKNKEALQEFWREGIRRMGTNESLVTIGMRGDGDEPMTEGTAIALLEQIVADQRQIIEEVTGKPAAETPQVWALYKEVQDYYDKGMRVPDDVTLLLCDDNWGNIRKLPKRGDSLRAGGYGIYYHFDYVGGPRNYKWINTNQISRTWEQMNLAYAHHARQLWVVNVGDIKPMELPTSFFLDFAWNPEAISASAIPQYGQAWAAEQFGEKVSSEVAEILHLYTQYNSRRKPELLDANTYSLTHFKEFERVVDDYSDLAKRAQQIAAQLDPVYESAFFQLVLFPVLASANLNEMYYAQALNRMYAQQGRVTTAEMGEKVRTLFAKDSLLTVKHHTINGGKWNHMMSQTHIGYTYWQQPEKNIMPEIMQVVAGESKEPGLWVEGSLEAVTSTDLEVRVPPLIYGLVPQRKLELFSRGTAFDFSVDAGDSFLQVSEKSGSVSTQQAIELSADWSQVGSGITETSFQISIGDRAFTLRVLLVRDEWPQGAYGEADGVVSMEAAEFTRSTETTNYQWREVPQLGRTQSGMMLWPVSHEPIDPAVELALEYDFYNRSTGEALVELVFSPTLNFHDTEGLRFAISLDGGAWQNGNLHAGFGPRQWDEAARTNTIVVRLPVNLTSAGLHTLRYTALDAGVVLQRIVVRTQPSEGSYLGPPVTRVAAE